MVSLLPLGIPFLASYFRVFRESGVGNLGPDRLLKRFRVFHHRESEGIEQTLFSALSSGEYWRSGRSMNERSLASAVLMRSSAVLRISRALRVGTVYLFLTYNVTSQFARSGFRWSGLLRAVYASQSPRDVRTCSGFRNSPVASDSMSAHVAEVKSTQPFSCDL